MINRTIFIIPIVYLCTIFLICSCGNTKSVGSHPTEQQAQAALEQCKKESAKAARKAKKKTKKRFWSMQTKKVKKRIKKTTKERKREARRKKHSIF